MSAAGMGRPTNPPIPLDFDGPYHLAITCVVSSVRRTTSDLHEESGGSGGTPPHGTPCSGLPAVGHFTNPHTLQVIKVPQAGCARFWIQFELGKSLFPGLPDRTLDILDAAVIRKAEAIFGHRIVQGCHWE